MFPLMQESILRSLKSKVWLDTVLANSRFAKRFAVNLKYKRAKMNFYTRTKSGRVSGGPDLKSSAAYTRRFCNAVLECWERAKSREMRPQTTHASLTELLIDVGYLPPAPLPNRPAPVLRRMTKLKRESYFC